MLSSFGMPPMLWSGSAASAMNLAAGSGNGQVYGIAGNQQVGQVNGRAYLWTNGVPGSQIELHRPEWTFSAALATSGSEQVGRYMESNPAGYPRAVLWRGTAASAVLLHPSWALDSTASAAAPGVQGGVYRTASEGSYRAALWAGTAQSLVTLPPPGISSRMYQAWPQGSRSGARGAVRPRPTPT